MVCYDAKHGGPLSGDNASVVVLIIVGDCQETSQSCNIVTTTMIVVWLAQNCWATRGGCRCWCTFRCWPENNVHIPIGIAAIYRLCVWGVFETCMSAMSELIIVGDNGGIMVLAPYPYKVSGSNVHIQKWDSCKWLIVCLWSCVFANIHNNIVELSVLTQK